MGEGLEAADLEEEVAAGEGAVGEVAGETAGVEEENLSNRLELWQHGFVHVGGQTGHGDGQEGFPQQLGGSQHALGQQSPF